jgi:hypothetical protein
MNKNERINRLESAVADLAICTTDGKALGGDRYAQQEATTAARQRLY